MNAIQILATQPWVERLGHDATPLSLAGRDNRRHLCRRTKVGRTHLRPERPLFSRLRGAYGDGHRSGRDLDAAARAVAGIRRRHLHGAPVRRSNRARSIHLSIASGRCGSRRARRRFCPGWSRSGLPARRAFSLRLLGGWILAERLRSRMVRPAPRRMAADPRSAQDPHFRLPAGPPAGVGTDCRRRPPSDGFGRSCWCRWARSPVCRPRRSKRFCFTNWRTSAATTISSHILQSAVEAVFFYHPAVWWISGHMRAERELCCDDIAVSVTGDAVIYARALAEFDSARWIQPTVMAANGGSLADRIARLLGQSVHLPPRLLRTGNRRRTDPVGDRGVGRYSPNPPLGRSLRSPPSSRLSAGASMNVRPLPGRLTADASLQMLIQYAYGVQPFQVVGGPGWMQSERYEIDAKADGNASRDQMFLMLQSLLEDRFQLKIHRETRDLPVYALVAAKGGLKLPPPKEGGCVDSAADAPAEWAGGRMAPPGQVPSARRDVARPPSPWGLALEQQFGTTMNLRAQYVGTRAVNQPYETQVNGYQTVCQGCFAPFPYGQPSDPRFGAVTQLSTGANSHYNGLQLTADKRLTHGLQVLANYTWSRCMDTVSNGGFLPFSAGGILTPLPGELGRQYGPCDYDVRGNFTAQYVYQLPFKARGRALGAVVNGWQVSGTAFWHSGVPFSVLSTPYSANGDGIVQGSGPQFASVVAGVPLYEHQPIAGVTPSGTVQWLNPNAFVSAVDPSTGACTGGDNPQNCQFGNLGRNAVARSRFRVGRFLSDEMVYPARTCKASP